MEIFKSTCSCAVLGMDGQIRAEQANMGRVLGHLPGKPILVESRRSRLCLGVPLPDHPLCPNQGPRHRLWPGPRLPRQRRALLLLQRRRVLALPLRRRPGRVREDLRKLSLHPRRPEHVCTRVLRRLARERKVLSGLQRESGQQTVPDRIRILRWERTAPAVARSRRQAVHGLQDWHDYVSSKDIKTYIRKTQNVDN